MLWSIFLFSAMPSDKENEVVIVKTSVKQAITLPVCFHRWGEYANMIVNTKGEERNFCVSDLYGRWWSDFKDPLMLWAVIASRFPILARFARRILAICPTSVDVERIFSHFGDFCTPDRNSLSAHSINMLATCNLHLRRVLGIRDKRNVKSAARE